MLCHSIGSTCCKPLCGAALLGFVRGLALDNRVLYFITPRSGDSLHNQETLCLPSELLPTSATLHRNFYASPRRYENFSAAIEYAPQRVILSIFFFFWEGEEGVFSHTKNQICI